jgi:hypothetical protein
MDLKTLWLPIGAVWGKLVKCLPAIVAAVEKAMQDGKITAQERKEVAMEVVNAIATEFGFKLGWLAQWAIGILIDIISKKLPSKDIIIPEVVLKVTKDW